MEDDTMTNADTKADAKVEKKAREGRSPGFPFIDLEKALERAEQFRVAEGKHSVPADSAKKAWKFGDESVIARRTVASLGYYGLFDDEGHGPKRKVKLSESALKILLDKQPVSPERDALIQTAALTPPAFKELWEKWGNELPSDTTFETYLIRDRGYSSGGAKDLISAYKNTLAFAKLYKSAKPLVADGRLSDPPPAQIDVGDFVQIEIDGVFQLPKAKRVRAIREDQGKNWIFIEGSETGIPMEQARLEQKGSVNNDKPLIPPTLAEAPLPVGEREWLRGPLSKDVSYRLVVAGDLGPKEIGKLITLLKAQQSVLSGDDGEETDA